MKEIGQYQLRSLIGEGGMGEVYRAYDSKRDRDVALKLLPAALSEDPEYQQRFRRESYVVARLREPHVIPIHDYGEIDGRLYIDMRLVDGTSLGDVIEQDGPLSAERTIALAAQIAEALDSAHADGLVHRDIKPSNVLVTAHDFVYVVDFGLAYAVGTPRPKLTMTGVTLGTLDYMAPERFSGRSDVDARTDVYSLACLIFECLTTTKPFPGDFPSKMFGHVSLEPPRASERHTNAPPALDAVIARGMAKDPDDRYAAAGDLVAAARKAAHVAPAAPAAAPVRPAAASAAPSDILAAMTGGSAATTAMTTQSLAAPPRDAGPERRDPHPSGPTLAGVIPGARTPEDGPPRSPGSSGPHPAEPPGPPPPSSSGPGPTTPPPSAPAQASTAPASGKGPRNNALWAIVALLAVIAIVGVALLVPVGGTSTTDTATPTGQQPFDPDQLTSKPAVATAVPKPTTGATVRVGPTPGYMEIAPNGKYAYAANRAAGVITVFDTTRNAPTGTIPVPDGGPQFVAFAPDGARAYVSIFNKDYSLNEVAVIDTASSTILARVPTGKRPFALDVTPDGKKVYVPNHDSGDITVIDTATNAVINTIKVAPNPHWLDISPDGKRIYAANHESNVITVLDTSGDRVLGTTPVGKSPHSIVWHPTKPVVINANYDDSTVTVTDVRTGAVVTTVSPTAIHPQDITLSADGKYAYIAAVDANTVQVLDTNTWKVTADVPVGKGPTSVAVASDGRQAYVTNLLDGTVTVLNVAGTA